MTTEVKWNSVAEPKTQTNESSNGGKHFVAISLKQNNKQRENWTENTNLYAAFTLKKLLVIYWNCKVNMKNTKTFLLSESAPKTALLPLYDFPRVISLSRQMV